MTDIEAWNNDSYAQKLKGRKVILICNRVGYCYTSLDGDKTTRTRVEVMQSTSEMTDSRIGIYVCQRRRMHHNSGENAIRRHMSYRMNIYACFINI